MILDYTKPYPKTFGSKSEELFHNLLVVADKLYLNELKDSELWNEFNKTFRELQIESLKDNFYWQFCSPKVYLNHYRERETEFLNENNLLNSLAFAQRERDLLSMMVQSNSYSFTYNVLKKLDKHNSYSSLGFQISYLHSIDLLPLLKVSAQEKIQFLDKKISSFISESPHPRYFVGIGFALFEKLKDKLVRKNKELADYSFIYRQMQKDGYIYDDIKEIAFRDWLQKTYNAENLDYQLKTIENCITQSKLNLYAEVLSSFK